MSENHVRVGKIVGCHGVRGDLKIRPTSEDAGWAKVGQAVSLRKTDTTPEQTMTIQSARQQGPLLVIHFQEIADRNQAELWIGATLLASLKSLPPPKTGEYWADDLIGLAVVDTETGRIRGKVKDLLSSSGLDFLEIQLDEAVDTVVIPFNNHFFPAVDTEQKTITMDLLSDFLALSANPITADRLEQ